MRDWDSKVEGFWASGLGVWVSGFQGGRGGGGGGRGGREGLGFRV